MSREGGKERPAGAVEGSSCPPPPPPHLPGQAVAEGASFLGKHDELQGETGVAGFGRPGFAFPSGRAV